MQDNSKELSQQPDLNTEQHLKPTRFTSIRRKLATAAKALDETFAITNRKVPVEEINTQTVSEKILNNLGNPLRESMEEDHYANPFDITAVITELGYVEPWNNTDYLKKFPGVYGAVKQSLWGLEQQGVLESRDFEPNSHNESKYYKVVDQNLLKQTASSKDESPI